MPVGSDRNGRIPQDVTDISSANQLIRYAAAGQLDHLLGQWGPLTQGKIALAAGFGSTRGNAGAALSAALKSGLSAGQLQRLDEIIGALAPDLDGTGGLSSLALRLSAERNDRDRGSSLSAHVPPSWTRTILEGRPTDEVGVLVQASALLSAFIAADKVDLDGMGVTRIRERYGRDLELLVRRLSLISAAPPTSRNYDAQILLGSLANYAFEMMRDHLEGELWYSPLGFRVWRAITKLVKLNAENERTEAPLKAWIRRLIRESEDLRKRSLYAGRSLDLELAINVPARWSPPGDDWVSAALLQRAQNDEATIRERGTAVMGLWERAVRSGRRDLDDVERELRGLSSEFRKSKARPDAEAGLRWIAASLDHAIKHRVAVCNDWPDVDEPWFRHVQEAADELDVLEIPAHLRAGTKNLFRHMILQNAGIYRRQAVETVVTSGMNMPVARALGFLLEKEPGEAWLRVRAQFALGFLERPDLPVEADLTSACLHAYRTLRLDQLPVDKAPPRAHITQMHAALFAVGDCFGVAGAEERARSARETLRPVLTELAALPEARALPLRRATRAAAYLLTVTAQPREGAEPDLSEQLLEKMRNHPDLVTARLSRWALSFRFAPDGSVRPLLAAAELDRQR